MHLVKESSQTRNHRLWRTICRWWKEIQVLIVIGATTGKVEANNTSVKRIKRTARGVRRQHQLHNPYYAQRSRQNSGESSIAIVGFTLKHGEPLRDFLS